MALHYFLISSLFICVSCMRNQYRVPHTYTDQWESYEFQGKEYILQNLRVKWKEADILCRGHQNATLATIDTPEVFAFLGEVLAETQFALESVWVGARRTSSLDPLGYRWLSGVPLPRLADHVLDGEKTYKKDNGIIFPIWLNRTLVPVPTEGSDCVAVDRVFHDKPVFLDLPCNLQRGFVCVKDTDYSVDVKTVGKVQCNTGTYHIFNGRLNWDQAAAQCVLENMALANIQSMKCIKKISLAMLRARPSIERAWIGAKGTEGKWAWIETGLDVSKPPPFLDTDPSNWPPLRDRNALRGSGCLQIDQHSWQAPVFLEARCQRKMQFVCYEISPEMNATRRLAAPLPSDDNFNYLAVRDKMTWDEAFENCQKLNGTLAFIENNEMLTQILMLMGETDNPTKHVWLSGRLNVTKDPTTDAIDYSWCDPNTGKKLPNPFTNPAAGTFMMPWLDEEYSIENSCLNLDREDHLTGLVYGLPCDTVQESICMVPKTQPTEGTTGVLLASDKDQKIVTSAPLAENPEVSEAPNTATQKEVSPDNNE